MTRPTTALCAAIFTLAASVAATAGPLSDSEWRPVEIAGAEPASDAELSLSFGDNGQMTGRSGCNSFFASYEVDGDLIEIGPLGTTMMACDEPTMNMEAGFLKALAASRRFEASRYALTLSSADGTTILHLVRKNTPTLANLAGSEWRPVSIGGADLADETQAFIQFRSAGALAGNGGCNQFTGEFTAGDGRMEIGPLAATRMACPGPAMQLETDFLNALSQARQYETTLLTLILRDDDGNTLARLTRTDAD